MSRLIVVTGSASGIGAAVRAELETRGDRVIGVDLREAEVAADLGKPEGRADAVRQVKDLAPDGLDGVVTCAGVLPSDERAIAVNFFGAVEVVRGLRPLLRAQSSRVVVVGSRSSLKPVVEEVVQACLGGDEARALALTAALPETDRAKLYATGKRALSRWVRREATGPDWAGAGIPLNVVAPGLVDTPMVAGIVADPAQKAAALTAQPMPLGGMASAPEVATVVLWLLSPENTRLTGQVLFVDGGGETLLRPGDIWAERA